MAFTIWFLKSLADKSTENARNNLFLKKDLMLLKNVGYPVGCLQHLHDFVIRICYNVEINKISPVPAALITV